MSECWHSIKLADAVEILNGFAFKSSNYVPEGIRVIRISNVQKGYVEDKDPKYYPSSSLKEIKKFLLQEGDLLMSLTGNVGRVGILPGSMLPCALNQRVACLRVKNDKLSKMFMFYLLNSNDFETKCIKSSSGVAQLNMSTEWLKEQVIPLPPLPEQQRIVDILDQEFAKIDALKANAEKSLQAAKDLFQATLKKELEPKEGWRTEFFGEVCQYNKEQGLFPSLRYVGMENIEAESGILLGTSSGELVQSSSFHFVPGDVLYGRLRPYLKKVVVADFEGCCSTEIFPIRSKECIPSFLQYWFLTDTITNKINATCSGCRMPRANMKDVLSFEISFPDKREQELVVSRIRTLCDNAIVLQQNYQKTLALCDDLKQSLLRKAFNGEL